MSLEILDEGRQKPAPVMGDPVLPAEDIDTEGGPGV